MLGVLDPEDAELDRLWRARYGEPIPLRGCAELAREIMGLSRDEVVGSAGGVDLSFCPDGGEEALEMGDEGGGHGLLL